MCVDIGLCHTGVAVYDFSSKRFVYLDCINTSKDEGSKAQDNIKRCRLMYLRLVAIAERYKVTHAAVELPHGGARSSRAMAAMAMATAVTACFVAAAQVEFFPVTPLQIKRLVSPTGRAVSKEEVQEYVSRRFGDILPAGSNKEHIADAVMCLEVYQNQKLK